jgi:phenylpyruvate tautomerase PptA (4-oxalocrotonate tautomerase family)
MPMIEVTTTKGAFDEETKERLAADLSTIALELEAAPYVDFGDAAHMQALAWCFINEQQVYVGGQVLEKPTYRVVVTIPDGAPGLFGPLAERSRAKLVERVTSAVLTAEGSPSTLVEAHRVWVQLRSIPNGQWGAFGEVVTLPDLAAYGMNRGEPGGRIDRMRRAALESVGAERPSEPIVG